MYRLSETPVWAAQRAYYEQHASAAFAEIPHRIVDNPFVAAAYARVIVGFLRDCELDRTEPVCVLELGAGAGRFAHACARELRERLGRLGLPPLRYILTDLGERTLAEWAANPALDGLEFARYDIAGEPPLERPVNPLVVIANYVFDSVPADAFAISGGVVEEVLVDAAGAPAGRRPAPAYGDADLDALLERYRENLGDTVVTLPVAALACLRRLRERSGDRLLVLAGDKAHSTEEALDFRTEPELRRHAGAFSLMVNFHALGCYAERHGGAALLGGDRHAALDVGAFVFGPGEHAQLRLAYEDALERFGPGDHALLCDAVERTAGELSVAELVAFLRYSGWDGAALLSVAGALRERLDDADDAVQEDLRHALHAIVERHFAVPGEDDLPFTVGVLLFELGDVEDALECFEASLAQHGPHEATQRNIALCQAQLM